MLYHFTGVEGLMGITESKALRASLAVSMNDQSEVVHAVIVAKRLLKAGTIRNGQLATDILRFLQPTQQIREIAIPMHAFVVSFCAREDSALHWLHYGQQGRGFALGFDPHGLGGDGFSLLPVLYGDDEQQAFIAKMLVAAEQTLAKELPNVPKCGHETLTTLSAHSAAQYVWAAGSQLKSKVFETEAEWRLVSLDVGQPIPASSQPFFGFRNCGGRLVPYAVHRPEPFPLREIVMGASVPMHDADPAFDVLHRQHRLGDLAVRRSLVPVRP